MFSTQKSLLTRVLAEPAQLGQLSLSEWDLLVRQARDSDLLARLYYLCEAQRYCNTLPQPVLQQLRSAIRVTQRHAALVSAEAARIETALQSLHAPVVLLKGAAYTLAKLPPANGRLFTDIDILLPHEQLPRAEKLLERQGWLSSHHGDYDDRYYRRWMHELPPLKHAHRQTLLDVHHAILPLTARLKPSSVKLLASCVAIEGHPGLYRLGDEDLVLHSAAHLFHDGEFEHGLRDLVDIDSLLRRFSMTTGFWSTLLDRASEMDLKRPLFYALEQAQIHLLTPIPAGVIMRARGQARMGRGVNAVMRYLFCEGLRANHSSCRGSATNFAEWLLYLRAHCLRMPWYLLLPHLFYKGVVAPIEDYRVSRRAISHGGLEAFMAKKLAASRAENIGSMKLETRRTE